MNTPEIPKHSHAFNAGNPAAERGTRLVMAITAATMVVEIWAGWWFNSMALLADGWHMSSHAVAIGVSAFAYVAARRHADDPRFAFGTWKIEVLGGFASALFLLGVAAMMIAGSVQRVFSPQPIQFREAIAVAVLGLIVNVVCALILGDAHDHDHDGVDHHHDDHDHHHDLNLRSAYLHVLADAATSLLAILALVGGLWLGWNWLDPLMGIVGAVLVGIWARGLLRDTSRVLLDSEMDHPLTEEIRAAVGTLDHRSACLAGRPQPVRLHPGAEHAAAGPDAPGGEDLPGPIPGADPRDRRGGPGPGPMTNHRRGHYVVR
jgi:cation diffusion facilitator family transporter